MSSGPVHTYPMPNGNTAIILACDKRDAPWRHRHFHFTCECALKWEKAPVFPLFTMALTYATDHMGVCDGRRD